MAKMHTKCSPECFVFLSCFVSLKEVSLRCGEMLRKRSFTFESPIVDWTKRALLTELIWNLFLTSDWESDSLAPPPTSCEKGKLTRENRSNWRQRGSDQPRMKLMHRFEQLLTSRAWPYLSWSGTLKTFCVTSVHFDSGGCSSWPSSDINLGNLHCDDNFERHRRSCWRVYMAFWRFRFPFSLTIKLVCWTCAGMILIHTGSSVSICCTVVTRSTGCTVCEGGHHWQ